jgi:ATP-dependent protease ClpP protease subunit
MTAPRSWFLISNRAGEIEIFIYDEIGGFGVNAKDFIGALEAAGSTPIRLRVNSPGGSAFDAVSIFNSLRAHPHKVVAWVDGIAASAASVVVMGAGEIVMPENSMLMVHDPHALVLGTSRDLRGMADALDKVKGSLVSAYRRSGKPDRTISEWMANESWFTADEAVNAGLADRLERPVKIAAAFDLSRFNYRHPPAQLTAPAATWGKVISAKFQAR